MTRALPSKLAEQTHTSEIYPDVTFILKPLTNRLQTHLSGVKVNMMKQDDSDVFFNSGDMMFEIASFALIKITGLINPDGTEFELEKEKIKVGNQAYDKVSEDSLNRIPSDLFAEIAGIATNMQNLTRGEQKEIKNSSESYPQNQTDVVDATEMNQSAPTDQ